MRVWDKEQQQFNKFDKTWGKNITEEDFSDNLASFFGEGGLGLVEKALEWAKELEKWMEGQGELRFISSSMLFVYDGTDKGLLSFFFFCCIFFFDDVVLLLVGYEKRKLFPFPHFFL